MSALQQIILHPYLSQLLRFWSTTVGRDKTYRTIQYAARFLAWYEYRKGATKETVARLTALKSQLGLSRKRKFDRLYVVQCRTAPDHLWMPLPPYQ